MNRISEFSIESKSENCFSVLLKWLIDIIWISNIFSSFDFVTVKISLSKNFFSSDNIFLYLFTKENVIDFDKVC